MSSRCPISLSIPLGFFGQASIGSALPLILQEQIAPDTLEVTSKLGSGTEESDAVLGSSGLDEDIYWDDGAV